MNAFIKTTLVILFTAVLFSSCKNNKSNTYRAYYQTINSEYAKIRAAQAAQAEMGDLDVDDDFIRNDLAQLQKDLAEAKAAAQAYKDAYDKAFLGERGDNSSKEPEDTETYDESNREIFREDKVSATTGYEGKLKKYSVVVATLSKQFGVNYLTKAFAETNEPVVVVQNARGWYYFVLGSYDNVGQAMNKRNEVLNKYYKSYSQKELMSRYAIPFYDTWILINR